MPRSSGTFTPVVNSWYPAVNGVNATAADWNAVLDDVSAAITTSVATDGTSTVTANLPMSNFKLTGLAAGTATGDSLRWQQLFSQGVETDVASGATVNIGAINSNFLRITGTTTITSFGTSYNGPRFLRFADALTLTHNASTLVLPGGANITTAAGDTAVVVPIGNPASGWQVLAFQRATTPVVGAVIDRAYAEYTTNANITALIPNDDTLPQNTEGTQILSVSLTPKSTTNRIRLRFQGMFSSNTAPGTVAAAVFSSASASALRSTLATSPQVDYPQQIVLEHEYVPGTTAALTFTVRVGPISGVTIRMNGTSSARLFGGSLGATLVVEEIAA